ncbi:hypothetical protein [Rhodobacter sp. NSM]|uniref:hypothetical protein n=1 Tax=Rhodobacter sp. NSM TaxID=3457501 RepID=UPI003FD69436
MADKVEMMATHATSGVALAGVTITAWLPGLKGASEIAAMWMPILGVVWLVVQIVRAVWPRSRPPQV